MIPFSWYLLLHTLADVVVKTAYDFIALCLISKLSRVLLNNANHTVYYNSNFTSANYGCHKHKKFMYIRDTAIYHKTGCTGIYVSVTSGTKASTVDLFICFY